MLERSRTRACQVVFEKSLHPFTDRSQNIDRLLFRGEGFCFFPSPLLSPFCSPRFLPHLGPFLCENPRRKFFTFGVKSGDERGEGKNAKVFTLNPLCNSEIREVGEEVKAFF